MNTKAKHVHYRFFARKQFNAQNDFFVHFNEKNVFATEVATNIASYMKRNKKIAESLLSKKSIVIFLIFNILTSIILILLYPYRE